MAAKQKKAGGPSRKVAGSKPQSFRAALEYLGPATGPGLGWTIARVPFAPKDVWPKMLRLRVKGEIYAPGSGSGFAFRTSLFPHADSTKAFAESQRTVKVPKAGGYFLLVNKAMQRAAGVGQGEMAQFTLEPDLDPREATLPDELAVLMDDEPGLRKWYDSLSENTRRQMGTYLMEPQSEAARSKRAEQMAERMLATMESEKELPPMIVAAFRRRPKARAGWQKMTPTQRRMELFTVHAYKTPESQQRRIEKLCDSAEKKA
jgi:uncharacterized protein YdeI (YjbR/CyaY-like superfamily)